MHFTCALCGERKKSTAAYLLTNPLIGQQKRPRHGARLRKLKITRAQETLPLCATPADQIELMVLRFGEGAAQFA